MDSISSVRRASALAEIEAMDWFQSIRWQRESESTNKQLAQEVRAGLIALPALLVADQQSGGMGRGGNRWFSPAGCLMFSMALPLNPANLLCFRWRWDRRCENSCELVSTSTSSQMAKRCVCRRS